ncbi:MAG: hypothetical protein ACYTG0_43590 [Planctomycetota bacterium]|jgi:hypothetical protein
MELELCDVQRSGDGVILVRVHSEWKNGRRFPDAIFSFRRGDPQYDFWVRKLKETSAAE